MSKSLATVVYVNGVAYGPGPVDDDIAEQITNPKVWADESDEAAEQAPADPPAFDLEHATKAELEAEIDRRNEGRDEADLIVVAEPGNKPELKAALAADNA
jgi:hypothetical protein